MCTGGSVAALYALHLRKKIPELKVVCFGSPACVDDRLNHELQQFTTTIFNQVRRSAPSEGSLFVVLNGSISLSYFFFSLTAFPSRGSNLLRVSCFAVVVLLLLLLLLLR